MDSTPQVSILSNVSISDESIVRGVNPCSPKICCRIILDSSSSCIITVKLWDALLRAINCSFWEINLRLQRFMFVGMSSFSSCTFAFICDKKYSDCPISCIYPLSYLIDEKNMVVILFMCSSSSIISNTLSSEEEYPSSRSVWFWNGLQFLHCTIWTWFEPFNLIIVGIHSD